MPDDGYTQAILGLLHRLGPLWKSTVYLSGGLDWNFVEPIKLCSPTQGWKIHVTSSNADACNLINFLAELTVLNNFSFKIPSNIDDFKGLNAGNFGLLQVGKVATIYTRSGSHARALASLVDHRWSSPNAPEVRTDLQLRPGSNVFLRYGAFRRTKIVRDFNGTRYHSIRSPMGIQPDARNESGLQPLWADKPISGMSPSAASRKPTRIFIGDDSFVVVARLHVSPKGNVYLALNNQALPHVIKSANLGVAVDKFGRDCIARLHHEHEILLNLSRTSLACPKVVGICGVGTQSFLVMEEVQGVRLDKLSVLEARRALLGLVATVDTMHSLGYVHLDIKLSNAIRYKKQTYLLDFEHASPIGADVPDGGGTRGHRDTLSPRLSIPPSDIFSLGACVAHVYLGIDPSSIPEGPGRLVGLLVDVGRADVADVVRWSMHLLPSKRPTAHTLFLRIRDLISKQRFDELRQRPQGKNQAKHERVLRRCALTKPALFAIGTPKAAKATQDLLLCNTFSKSHSSPAETLDCGVAGALLGIASLEQTTRLRLSRVQLLGALNWLIRHADTRPALGLFSGQAGIALALAILGRRLSYLRAIEKSKVLLSQCCQKLICADLYSGRAGVIWAATLMAKILHQSWPLEVVAPLVGSLLDELNPNSNKRKKFDFAKLQLAENCGAAHGPAGLALALAAWGDLVGEQSICNCAEEIFQITDHLSQNKWKYIFEIDRIEAVTSWKAGRIGFLWAVLQAFGYGAKSRPVVAKLVHFLTENPLASSCCYHRGLSGQLEIWSMLRETSEFNELSQKRGDLTVRLINRLSIRDGNTWSWHNFSSDVNFPALWTGSLGTACALSRYWQGETAPILSATWLKRISHQPAQIQIVD